MTRFPKQPANPNRDRNAAFGFGRLINPPSPGDAQGPYGNTPGAGRYREGRPAPMRLRPSPPHTAVWSRMVRRRSVKAETVGSIPTTAAGSLHCRGFSAGTDATL